VAERFTGKVVIVTGAARGMGKATAAAFAREGARVAVNDLVADAAERAAAEIRASGGEATAIAADVSQRADAQRLAAETVQRYGTVDVLVNNAGILSRTAIESISEEEWDRVMAVNVRGVFLCAQAVLPIMKARRYGRIVNVASSAGRSVSTFGGAAYTTSKAAVLGLTRHIAREGAPFGITCNSTSPGSMDTEMVRENATPERIAAEIDKIPLGRLGTGDDEARLVLFLASDDASYITGATVDINGGDLMI
jgi:NAD(P)-dependent dehydrogenase (short-subunit alcohol dehydrogenase family)